MLGEVAPNTTHKFGVQNYPLRGLQINVLDPNPASGRFFTARGNEKSVRRPAGLARNKARFPSPATRSGAEIRPPDPQSGRKCRLRTPGSKRPADRDASVRSEGPVEGGQGRPRSAPLSGEPVREGGAARRRHRAGAASCRRRRETRPRGRLRARLAGRHRRPRGRPGGALAGDAAAP